MTVTVRPLDDATYLRLGAGATIPLEQAPAWDAFDDAVPGRTPWRRLGAWEGEELVALASFTHLRGRGFRYLWAKHGPVWLAEATAARERALRAALVEHVRAADRGLVFVRLHARHPAPDLRELLQTVTYDRTVVLDLTPEEEQILAWMKKRGRRDVRKALRDESMLPTEETGLTREAFRELYQVLVETGGRDGFGISDERVYWTMLDSLGPEHARIFVTRREGRVLAWGLVTVNGDYATYYYAASSAEGRKSGAADLLVWHMATALRASGVRTFDLMGIDSPRAPQLTGVRDFKTKFSEEIAEVDGAWDVPVHPARYAALVAALGAKRRLVAGVRAVRGRLGR
ncbi:peptidoglycan bridge formation glycyltransferase FemA/FemB family protein [Georgenia yuyongxinii]|uniref:Peptidoglycan bridge formation glycyltransferase FemA/FemB family protein n=1 Tax=Georgenia yuyongxinii TaxID=2589797 RepID=A0A5B8C3B1_9MICO|nr:peptidoglycan bridge formation glycyltransferase FemA/FemB family protein [Georgenia yuyongxinii]QDC24677.1 peptidoglycan bridge formation glycyltransferase FemA/FemB family protein [Georgenia yuyongxinii]